MKLALSNSIKNRGGEEDWLPTKLSGLQFWYRKNTGILNDSNTPIEDNDAVDDWQDQSGNNKHAVGATTKFSFDAASGGVEGSGNNKLNITQIDFTGQFAFWVRLKFDTISGGANDIMFNDGTEEGGYTYNDDFFRVQTTTQLRSKIGGGTAMNYTCSTLSTGTYYNIGFERDGSDDCRAYLGTAAQGSEVNNTNDFNLDRVLGAFDGTCLEIVVSNAALSSAERSKLDTYLTNI